MASGKDDLGIPSKTLEVSRARSQLARMLHRLRQRPQVYLITESGKPAAALVNLDWLRTLLDQVRGGKRFTIFGQAEAEADWEKTLGQLRDRLRERTLQRHVSEK
jgi:hypothetical protein